MNNAKLTVRLPLEELAFAKRYAYEHKFSLTALIHRYLARLRLAETMETPVEVAPIAGIISVQDHVRDAYIEHVEKKHR